MSADLRLDLVVPVLRLGAFDPVEHFVGARIADLVEPLLSGPIGARRLRSGALVEVYPLRLPTERAPASRSARGASWRLPM